MDPRLLCALAALESADGDFCEDPASNPSRETLLMRALPALLGILRDATSERGQK